MDLNRLYDNLQAVRTRIAGAATDAGRRANEITLVAVTKYVSVDTAAALVEMGCRDLGESRPQQLWEKAETLAGKEVRWHLVGHLQRNKVRRTLPHLHLLHSGDSMRLLEELSTQAASLGMFAHVLLEVNISGDAEKHGWRPDELERSVHDIFALSNIEIRGLMGMAAREGDLATARANFDSLYSLHEKIQFITNRSLGEISMGMSGDLEAAIAAGATMVRVGSALFEGV